MTTNEDLGKKAVSIEDLDAYHKATDSGRVNRIYLPAISTDTNGTSSKALIPNITPDDLERVIGVYIDKSTGLANAVGNTYRHIGASTLCALSNTGGMIALRGGDAAEGEMSLTFISLNISVEDGNVYVKSNIGSERFFSDGTIQEKTIYGMNTVADKNYLLLIS